MILSQYAEVMDMKSSARSAASRAATTWSASDLEAPEAGAEQAAWQGWSGPAAP